MREAKLVQHMYKHRDTHDIHTLQWAWSFLDSSAKEYDCSGWEMVCGMDLLQTKTNPYSCLDLRAVALDWLCVS